MRVGVDGVSRGERRDGGLILHSRAMIGYLRYSDALVLWAARRCGRPVKWISTRAEALQGDYHGRDQVVSAEMALRLGRLCGNGPEIWLNLQAQYDLALARARSAAQLEAVEPLG